MGAFSKKTSRREFAKTTAKAAALLTFGGALVPTETSAKPVIPTEATVQQPQGNQTPPAGLDALTQYVKDKYGKYLNDAQFADVKQGIERNLRTSERYGRLKLENGDEPVFRFHA
ncbi:MAG TPA: hypothetical protein VFC63_05880 [Blastocatellia bacterium]|nr:hypothetical protein [Blastocatellia bacterium]